MTALDLHLDTQQLEQLVRDLDATPRQAERAMRRTFTRMATWVRTRSQRGLSRELEVKGAIIRRRLRTSMGRVNGSLRVWYGLDPISLKDLGARQTSTGVRAGRHQRPGAFIGPGGHAFRRRGAARLPITKESLDIKDRADTFIEDQILGTDAFERQFWTVFERELQWQMRQRR